jgi:hypothetical protein
MRAWADRVRAIGHGGSQPMTPAEALAVAIASDPMTPEATDLRDPQGLSLGMMVSVVPLGIGGDPPVVGRIQSVSRDTVALAREHPARGRIVVHFPPVGYRVSPR